MADRPTDAALLDVLQHLIKIYRPYRNTPKTHEYEVHQALVALATEIRARQPESTSATLVALQDAIDRCKQSRTALGYEAGHLQRIGEELIGRWPTVRNVLTSSLPF